MLYRVLIELLEFITIVFVNIKTRLLVNNLKNDISNLYSGLNICHTPFIHVILAPCLANFNYHLIRNINLFTKLVGQVLIAELFKLALQTNCYIFVILIILFTLFSIC